MTEEIETSEEGEIIIQTFIRALIQGAKEEILAVAEATGEQEIMLIEAEAIIMAQEDIKISYKLLL